jgi:sterol desaturase/sphingolipid hydroxylase (fatty acid hydroxylase superfamily)
MAPFRINHHVGKEHHMGLFVSLIMIALGAILAWAVHPSSSGSVDVNTVGYIILVVGVLGLILDLMLWESWGPRLMHSRRTVVAGGPEAPAAPAATPRRRTVVEEEDVL